MTLNAVVLPAPFGPIRPATAPSSTSSETSSSATIPPNRSPTFRRERRATRASVIRSSRRCIADEALVLDPPGPAAQREVLEVGARLGEREAALRAEGGRVREEVERDLEAGARLGSERCDRLREASG